LLYVGSLKESDRRLVESAGVQFVGVPAGKWRRYFDLRNVWDLVVTAVGVVVAVLVVGTFWPDKVFIKGGYVGLPVGVAAWLWRRPIVLHDSDVVMGITNRWLSRLASQICVAFPTTAYPSNPKLIHTGLPLAPVFYDKTVGTLDFGLRDDRPLVFVTGGSQGARGLNRLARGALPELLKRYQVVHQAGYGDYPALQRWADSVDEPDYHLFDVLPNTKMASLIKRASVVVARSGSFVFEVAAVGRAAILVPLPGSANNHQQANADYLKTLGAAVVLDQNQAESQDLVQAIDRLVGSDAGKRLAFNIKELARPDAAQVIADLLLQV